MIDRPFFFKSIRDHLFDSLSQSQVDGLNHLLDVWEANYSKYPFSYLAYALATTFHETAKMMQPIEEYGRGKGKAYGPTGFWGRGYVQLTWRQNYVRASTELAKIGVHVDLVSDPALALDPVTAAHILFLGMAEGWFTGKSFSTYLPSDPVNARRIINGTDRAQTVASYYTAFNASIRATQPAINIASATTTPSTPSIWSKIGSIFSRNS